jgi:hypothetical protein
MADKFFVRFVNTREQAQKDLERGFSFDSYLLLETPEDVLEFFGIEYDDLDEAIEEHGLAEDNGEMKGWWGKALDGLCGFECESLEEARELVQKNQYGKGVHPFQAIYTGWYTGFEWDGDRFHPTGLVEVNEL